MCKNVRFQRKLNIRQKLRQKFQMTRRLLKHLTTFFVDIVPSLKFLLIEKDEVEKEIGNDPLLNYIWRYRNHPSVPVVKPKKQKGNSSLLNFLLSKVLMESRT